MTDAWTDRLFVHCDRAEHIGIMETNNLGNNMWKCVWVVIICGLWNLGNKVIFKSGSGGSDKKIYYGSSQDLNMGKI